jgi:hypothetical protein
VQSCWKGSGSGRPNSCQERHRCSVPTPTPFPFVTSPSLIFKGATFTQDANFDETVFLGTATWDASRFLESAGFRRTIFDPQLEGKPSAVFALASLTYPRRIVFDDVDLSRALFHNCDVSEVWFTSSVRWAKRGSHGFAVFEESIPLEHASGLERDGKRDYRAIAQVYQQLKKNYDSRLDYWTANEFHFGEMEMKRLATPTEGRLLGLRRWMHRRSSLTAWYRYASDYGNSYRKPCTSIPVGAGARHRGDTAHLDPVWAVSAGDPTTVPAIMCCRLNPIPNQQGGMP